MYLTLCSKEEEPNLLENTSLEKYLLKKQELAAIIPLSIKTLPSPHHLL